MKSLLTNFGAFILFIGLSFLVNAEVWGADWRFVLGDEDIEVFYDAGNITRPSQDIVKTKIKILYSEKGVNNMVSKFGDKLVTLSYEIILVEYNCGDKRMRELSTAQYSKEGNVLFTGNDQNANWGLMSPEFVSEELYRMLCK